MSIEDAKNYFEKFEKSEKHKQRIENFTKALDIIDLLEGDSDISQEEKEIIQNLKISYSRRLIMQFIDLSHPDFNEYYLYNDILNRVKQEIDYLKQNDAILCENLEKRNQSNPDYNKKIGECLRKLIEEIENKIKINNEMRDKINHENE